MSKRLEILRNSLDKKQTLLNKRFDNHFSDVKSANGQPLNDKRNGRSTLNRWDRQNDSIRNQIAEVEKTKKAIDREESKINYKTAIYEKMPDYLKELIDSGMLNQWGKHPHILFVNGVEKARIYWDCDSNICSHRYVKEIPNQEQYAIFRDIFNGINKKQSNK